MEVATMLERVRTPEMTASPWTPRVVPGVEVPSPTNPLPLTTRDGVTVP